MTARTPPAQQPKCKDCESFRWIPPQPPSGYCEWCIADVCPEGHCGCSPSHFTIRSRPHPALAQGKEQCLCEVCKQTVRQCVERKNMEETARKAREDVLEELRKLCMNDESVGCTVFRHIQSLRSS